jgi:hypothetical protein
MSLQTTPPTLRPTAELDYHDVRSIELARPLLALDAWNLIMTEPNALLGIAFRLRDAISARFGVRRIGGFSGTRRDSVAMGNRLDFFLVEAAEPGLLVLTERDTHLDVMTCISTHGNMVTVTSSVVTHNWFGKAYMLPVGPAHKLLVSAMLRRLARKVSAPQTIAGHQRP